jgi:hypothetical protein
MADGDPPTLRGRSKQEIAAAAGVRYEVVLAIVRPR